MKKFVSFFVLCQIFLGLLAFEGVCQQRSYYWTQKGNHYYDNNVLPELEFVYYTKGVAAGEPGSVVMLAYCYLTEHGTQRNVKKAQQLLDAWATKSDVTAFAAMKFYLPKTSDFNYIQSVGYDEISFPFGEDYGIAPNMTKALKSLRYLENLCDNDKLVDIYDRYARELIARVKLYCHGGHIGGINLCGADYVSEQLLSGYYWLGADTVKAMFNKCVCRQQVDSVKAVLLGLHPKAEHAKVADHYRYPEMIESASNAWTSAGYSVFKKSVAEKDSVKCATSYLALDDLERNKADNFLLHYFVDSVEHFYTDSLFFKKSVEFHSFCPSESVKERNIYYCKSRVEKLLCESIEKIKQNEFDKLTDIKNVKDAEHIVKTVKSCAATEKDRSAIILKYKEDVLNAGLSVLLNEINRLEPTSHFFREESGYGVVFRNEYLEDNKLLKRRLEKYSSVVKYKTEFSSFFDESINIIEIMKVSNYIPYMLAACRYNEYYAFLSVLSSIKKGTDKYEDYGTLHSIADEYKAIESSSDFEQMRTPLNSYSGLFNTNFDMVVRYFQPFEDKAFLAYQDECAISAAEKLTINSTKAEISAVLKMPMTKEAKAIVKEKTKKSYLKSKSLN